MITRWINGWCNCCWKLAGVTPTFAEGGFEYPTYQLDRTKRRAITGPCQVPIRDGLIRMYNTLAPSLKGE